MSALKKEVVNPTVDKRIEQYVAIRDRLKEMKDKYEESCAPLKAMQDQLSGWLQDFLETSGSESIRTKHGTCFASTRYTASLADPQAFMDYVIQNQEFDLLDRKANATAVRAFVEENGNLPPGCNLSALRTVGVRRGKGDNDE